MQEKSQFEHQENTTAPQATPPQQTPVRRNESPIKKVLSSISGVASTVALVVSAVLLAWLLINFVFQTYVVDGSSMVPTLHENDRLIVLKAGKTWADIQDNNYIPERNSIIVFTRDGMQTTASASQKQLIKRVVGVPGDRVVIRNGNVTIYNNENPDGFSPDLSSEYNLSTNVTTAAQDFDITVGQGEVFVLGDNRSNSLDSRSFGTIDSENIVGELIVRLLPLNDARTF